MVILKQQRYLDELGLTTLTSIIVIIIYYDFIIYVESNNKLF